MQHGTNTTSNERIMQTSTATLGDSEATIRWAKVGNDFWIHAADLLSAMGYKTHKKVLDGVRSYLQGAGEIPIPGAPPEAFINRAGAEYMFSKRTGGTTGILHDFIQARVYGEDADVDDESVVSEAEAPPISWAELSALEQATQARAQTTFYQSQALESRARVLDTYLQVGGDRQHPDFTTSRDALLNEMRRPYPCDFIDVREYLLLLGYTEEAALAIATPLGADVKRAYTNERGVAPQTYSAVFAGHQSHVCVYHRYKDMELLGSCWRQFVKNRAWYREQFRGSEQRKQDRRRLQLMSHDTNGQTARGWGPARTERQSLRLTPW